MRWTGKHVSLAVALACGITVVAIGGLSEIGLLVAMSISGAVGYLLANWIARHYSRFSYPLQIAAPSSLIIVAAMMFMIAFVKGADAVRALPAWAWNFVVCYFCVAYALTARLYYHGARNAAPRV
jgi:hypothetical protein